MAAHRARPARRKRPKRPKAAKEPASPQQAGVRKRAAAGRATPAPADAGAPRRVAAARAVAVGRVVHYFAGASVAELALDAPIRCGETLHLRGRTTDFLQPVESLRRAGARIRTARARDAVTLAVAERVRPGDRVYRLDFPPEPEPAP